MNYRFEPLSHLLKTGLAELGHQSWNEIGNDKDVFSYDPDWAHYGQMERDDTLRFVAVRDAEGILVGYASVIITPNLHDRKVLCAIIQDIYLDAMARQGLESIRSFMGFLEGQLKGIGVKHISVGERENDPRGGIGIVWQRLGYRSAERIWTKGL